MKRLLALACLLLFAAHPAFAETRSVGYPIWNVIGDSVRVLYTLPDREVKNLAAAGAPIPTTKQVGDYLLAHLAVSRQGKKCPVIDQGQDIGLINTLALLPGILRFEIVFQCEGADGITLSDTAFSDRLNSHIDYARVQIDNGGFVQHVFTADAPNLALPGAGATPQSDSPLRYASLGISHVMRSAEILCFVLALLLVARRRRDYAIALGGLAAGYGLAILLAAFNLAATRFGTGYGFSALLLTLVAAVAVTLSLPDPRKSVWFLAAGALVLAWLALFFRGSAAAAAVGGTGLIAVSILFIANRERQRALFLLIMSSLFALLDGFTLSGDLAVLALPSAQMAPMLTGFGLGTLVAEMTLPLCLAAVWFLVPMLRRVAAPGRFLPDLGASVFVGFGIFWFSTWLYS